MKEKYKKVILLEFWDESLGNSNFFEFCYSVWNDIISFFLMLLFFYYLCNILLILF